MPNVTVVAGREAKLSCIVENRRDFKVAWVHYGDQGSAVLVVGTHVLTTNRRVSVAVERDIWSLVIANATVKDRGEYMCQISTVPPKKMHVTLEVRVPPHITVPPKDVTVNEGQNVTLECQATGDPLPKITWRRENTSLRHAQLPEGENEGPVLFLPSVSRSIAGAFLCVASNGVPPAVSARALLSVNYAPFAVGNDSMVRWIEKNKDVRLECRFKGSPKPTILWEVEDANEIETRFFRSERLVVSHLHLRSVAHTDFRTYKCFAKNTLGTAQITITIKERLVPTTTTTTTTSPQPPVFKKPSANSFELLGRRGMVPSPPSLKWESNQTVDMSLDWNIQGNKASNKDQMGKDGRNRTTENSSKEIETSPPKRFVQESPLGHIYPIADPSLIPSNTFNGGVGLHKTTFLCKIGSTLSLLRLFLPLFSPIPDPFRGFITRGRRRSGIFHT